MIRRRPAGPAPSRPKGAATTIVDIASDRQTVFDFLTEPRTYPDWLVGAQDMRAVERGWPAPGTRFHQTALGRRGPGAGSGAAGGRWPRVGAP